MKKLTPYQEWKEKRNQSIYAEWCKLTADKEQSKMEALKHLMKKHRINSTSTFYSILKTIKNGQSN